MCTASRAAILLLPARRPQIAHTSRAGASGNVWRPVCRVKVAVALNSPVGGRLIPKTAARNTRHAVHESASEKAAPSRFLSARASRIVTSIRPENEDVCDPEAPNQRDRAEEHVRQ